jgi:hypothetical protein
MAEEHRDIILRMTEFWEADRPNREDALDDQKFRGGDQWDAAVRQQRESEGRPVLTINRMGQFIKRVSGSLRQSHPSIQPIPVDDKGDPQMVEILSGLIRHIEYRSKASVAYAYGAECAIACGIGHWQIGTEYTDGAFDQEICIKRIMDPLAVIWDSKAVLLDRSDADEVYVTEWITDRDRKARFGKEHELGNDLPLPVDNNSSLYWRDDNRTRIASRWWRSPVKKKLGLSADGEIFDITKMKRADIEALGIVRDRDAQDYEIKHQAFDGEDFLADAQPWAGRHLPIVPVVGEEIAYDGNVVRHGVIRWAKDPQRLYNIWRTAAAEMIGLAPKAPFVLPQGMVDGLEHLWRRANSTNLPYLPYKPLPNFPNLRPQREAAPEPPAAMWQEASIAQDDMKATTGIYDAALGAKSNEVSGVAINARQGETDTGTFVYFDNFNHAIERTGTILVDLIPKIYDGDRIVRILGEDGEPAMVPINRTVVALDGVPELINDLSAGTYDVRIKTGPSYANAKEEAKTELGELMKQNPGFMQIFGDLYAESLDLPPEIKGKIADRIKRTIPPQILGPDEQSAAAPQPQPDPRQEAMASLEIAIKDADLSVKRANADKLTLQNEQLASALGLHPGAESPREMAPVVVGKQQQPQPQPAA